ncbi:MAG TPA: excalibur calcium-binding domain-containing protein [Kineosporiaceae bacterium]|nr:excalibur calcium-binding domain-containing protein [Kineosporiaceae bacterium]
MRKAHAHGVGLRTAKDKVAKGSKPVTASYRNDRLHRLNKGLDRDHDGIACEHH